MVTRCFLPAIPARPLLALILASVVSSVAMASQQTVTFDSFTGQQFFDFSNPTATSEGFDFTSSAFHFHIGDSIPNSPGAASGVLLNDIHDNIITMTRTGGGNFDLVSADVANVVLANTPTLRVSGVFAAGGTIDTTVSLNGAFHTESFNGFLALASVSFQGTGFDGLNGVNTFWLDNIVVNDPPATVPLPASVVLLLIAGTPLARVRRRS